MAEHCKPHIRDSGPEDLPALERLYRAAFPEEDLLPLVRQLVGGRDDVVSLVAEASGTVAAHLALTICGVEGSTAQVALLGPAAVAPDLQRQRLGDLVIRTGIDRMGDAGIHQVQVLRDPAYYSRFGFRADDSLSPPHVLPSEWRAAWQSVRPAPDVRALVGRLLVPEPWQLAELWMP